MEMNEREFKKFNEEILIVEKNSIEFQIIESIFSVNLSIYLPFFFSLVSTLGSSFFLVIVSE